MRTKAPMLFVLAVLVVGMAWQLAGVNAALGVSQSQSPSSGIDTGQLNDTAGNNSVEDGVSGQAPGSDAGGLIGIAISSGQALANIMGLVVMLPLVLDNGGVPYYWAYPLGLLAQLVAFIGLAQFVSNRNLR
jgi:hypothetical protein